MFLAFLVPVKDHPDVLIVVYGGQFAEFHAMDTYSADEVNFSGYDEVFVGIATPEPDGQWEFEVVSVGNVDRVDGIIDDSAIGFFTYFQETIDKLGIERMAGPFQEYIEMIKLHSFTPETRQRIAMSALSSVMAKAVIEQNRTHVRVA